MFNIKKKKEANNLENTDNRDAYKEFCKCQHQIL